MRGPANPTAPWSPRAERRNSLCPQNAPPDRQIPAPEPFPGAAAATARPDPEALPRSPTGGPGLSNPASQPIPSPRAGKTRQPRHPGRARAGMPPQEPGRFCHPQNPSPSRSARSAGAPQTPGPRQRAAETPAIFSKNSEDRAPRKTQHLSISASAHLSTTPGVLFSSAIP